VDARTISRGGDAMRFLYGDENQPIDHVSAHRIDFSAGKNWAEGAGSSASCLDLAHSQRLLKGAVARALLWDYEDDAVFLLPSLG